MSKNAGYVPQVHGGLGKCSFIISGIYGFGSLLALRLSVIRFITHGKDCFVSKDCHINSHGLGLAMDFSGGERHHYRASSAFGDFSKMAMKG